MADDPTESGLRGRDLIGLGGLLVGGVVGGMVVGLLVDDAHDSSPAGVLVGVLVAMVTFGCSDLPEYFTALSTRLNHTWRSIAGSPRTCGRESMAHSGGLARRSKRPSRMTPATSASVSMSVVLSSVRLMREKARRSSISRPICRAAPEMVVR